MALCWTKRCTNSPTQTKVAGAKAHTLYRPYGTWADNLTWHFAGAGPAESHGYIGQRLDADAGLLSAGKAAFARVQKPGHSLATLSGQDTSSVVIIPPAM